MQTTSSIIPLGFFTKLDNMATYYDALPDSAIATVIRFLSDRPRLSNWQISIAADTVLTLMRLSTFAEVTRATFNKISSVPQGGLYPSTALAYAPLDTWHPITDLEAHTSQMMHSPILCGLVSWRVEVQAAARALCSTCARLASPAGAFAC